MSQVLSSAGIFRLNRGDLPALEAAAGELGQAFFVVDLSRARNVPGFIKAMQRDLHFPDWFGHNLDALLDCLTDFSWHPAAGYVIVLSESDSLKATPTSLAALNEVLSCAVDKWNERGIAFRIFYLQDADARP
ncbi:barstar family protein [uncultured Propionivibrio sp.]|uniref:barstar family protein n=1 Tax=uncultured Propionivibrio sp. TaxID=426737 RepID=UPI0029C0363D|nr:barstar family protein [uncultured Propionivibrio sp.]